MDTMTYRPPKLGRPKGRTKVERQWQPTVWEPIYEIIVAESILGKTNIYLAKKYEYTETQISNILNTNKAREIKREAIEAIKKNSQGIIENQLADIIERSVDNIHHVIHDEELRLNNPFSVFSASIQALKGLGKLQGDGTVNNNTTVNVPNGNAVINLGEEQQEIFMRGLAKANEAIEKHQNVTGESIK
jgi:hypothetical protein